MNIHEIHVASNMHKFNIHLWPCYVKILTIKEFYNSDSF